MAQLGKPQKQFELLKKANCGLLEELTTPKAILILNDCCRLLNPL